MCPDGSGSSPRRTGTHDSPYRNARLAVPQRTTRRTGTHDSPYRNARNRARPARRVPSGPGPSVRSTERSAGRPAEPGVGHLLVLRDPVLGRGVLVALSAVLDAQHEVGELLGSDVEVLDPARDLRVGRAPALGGDD